MFQLFVKWEHYVKRVIDLIFQSYKFVSIKGFPILEEGGCSKNVTFHFLIFSSSNDEDFYPLILEVGKLT